jgi:hypothetical protein
VAASACAEFGTAAVRPQTGARVHQAAILFVMRTMR